MKQFKKVLALSLVLVMTVVLFAGCGSSNTSKTSQKDDPILGQWKCTALDMGSGDIMSSLGSSFGDSVVFYAWDDGTCRLSMMGSSFPMEWENTGDDYKLTIDLKSFAEANGMTEEELKSQLAGSTSAEIDETQSYRGVLENGEFVVDMAKYYDDAKDSSSSDSSATSEKMEFTFERTGDAPDKDEVESSSTTSTGTSTTTDSSASSADSSTTTDSSSAN
ncbi:MAG: hypothetical protein ACOYJI_06955 [Anaerovoracaceae bacterium]|jgi:hypothetical protein